MADRSAIETDRIRDYIDDRLGKRDRANVAAYLLAHPEIGAEVEQLRRQNEALKAVGQEILEEPVPDRLLSALRPAGVPDEPAAQAPSRWPFLEAAAAILLFVGGGAAGWFLNGQINPPVSEDALLTSQILHAYDFYDRERDYPIDFASDRAQDFDGWITRSFERSLAPPDLGKFKFAYAGGRLVPTASTPIGHFQFENDQQERLGIFFWQGPMMPASPSTLVNDDRVAFKLWVEGDFRMALVADRANPDFDSIADNVSGFYREALATH